MSLSETSRPRPCRKSATSSRDDLVTVAMCARWLSEQSGYILRRTSSGSVLKMSCSAIACVLLLLRVRSPVGLVGVSEAADGGGEWRRRRVVCESGRQ